jgi:hypothetical protein
VFAYDVTAAHGLNADFCSRAASHVALTSMHGCIF